MTFSKEPTSDTSKLIVDSIHGDIHLTPMERSVVDTASFQRLRHLKQLQMAQVTYPSATHTRFAHCVGVLGIMQKVIRLAERTLSLSKEQKENIRLAGLLHDVGHYPYSHLMEKIDKVQLAEEFVSSGGEIELTTPKYPKHDHVGNLIVTNQQDLVQALGSQKRAEEVGSLFTRDEQADPQLSKLIKSSLDMDRLDYLLRDSQATGVPYGNIDINYLLDNFVVSPSGMLGVKEKALAAVEHFLLARFFMHKCVYFHKTTYAIEEACRQLLRRVRDCKRKGDNRFEIPRDGKEVEVIVKGKNLGGFTDAYVDRIVEVASQNDDEVIQLLANSIRMRRPPKLLLEVAVLADARQPSSEISVFELNCKLQLKKLADDRSLPLGRFLFCKTPPLRFEERGALISEEEARDLGPEEREELIKVFREGAKEPVSVVSIDHSVLNQLSKFVYQSARLYFVRRDGDDSLAETLRDDVARWKTS